ncbi:hypothetical protein [Aggregatibacter actinomycetemcomitans]|uniref:hypothetical protein n=1 Tax=Aggregatibacter actinomycetemcomitans TaxID=714 RepID=UPI00197B90E4|nr:hypothetical protein [Aggregatibacter actinomycetemcomitans]MBN6064767.1 hypothetical protein [Aggregatibacter actinomycetemcomitans]MBN6070371.1 hypothetical protein [Aggregatibacter actinomycetemcomitans]MBN6081902.1 hypothetical protein [Aggregatibacter actinomycetemcomitans]MBN6084193.1 hypothetical protein [Aggregatibacter actinomycetemcomitans]
MDKSSKEQETKELLDELKALIQFLDISQLDAVVMIDEYYSKCREPYDVHEESSLSYESFKKILQGRHKASPDKLRLYINCLKQSKKYHCITGLMAAKDGDVKVLGVEAQKELHQLSKRIRDLIAEKKKFC